MIAVDDDLTVEMLFQKLEADGMDMTQMRTASASINAMQVGDNTPPPGTLRLAPLVADPPTLVLPPPPVLHQGLYDNPEGPFYLRVDPFALTRKVRRLTGKVRRLQLWVTGLTLCFISALVVIAANWHGHAVVHGSVVKW